MTSLTDWNDPPPDGWTIDDLDRLGEGGQRRELIDGVVPIGPQPGALHEKVVDLVCGRMQALCPAEYEVGQGVEIRFNSRRCFIPDVEVVLAGAGTRRRTWYEPREVVIAVEVVSPTSLIMDRITKPALYAAAGIPYYWRVETDGGVEVSTYRLDAVSETYRLIGESDTVIEAADPWQISIPIADVTP